MSKSSPITKWLASHGDGALNLFAVTAAFTTYFCMYAFRKPFAAAEYEGLEVVLLGFVFDQKKIFVISQIIGYALSKYLGMKFCSETGRARRFTMLVSLILAAELALILFGLAPSSSPALKALAIFANGLPLGMVWGLVVLYLEGRRMSEVLLTGLSCAYIVASGVVKDVGRAILAGADIPIPVLAKFGWYVPNPLEPVNDFWMPAVTGLIFLPPFILSAWLLEHMPDPSEEDEHERVKRRPMLHKDRVEFVRRYAFGIFMALAAFFVLTAFRDYRDNYMVEAFTQLGYDYENNKTAITSSELIVAFGVMAILSQLYRIHNNRIGLAATYAVMTSGLLLIGGATLMLDAGMIDGFWWITLIGFGAYIAYVPFGAVLFDRVIAFTGFTGTAVFGIYLADAIGYTGSVIMQLAQDVFMQSDQQSVAEKADHLNYLRFLSYLIASAGSVAMLLSCVSFVRRTSEAVSTAPDVVAKGVEA